VQANAADTHASATELATELHSFWRELMKGTSVTMVQVLEGLDLSITHMKVLYVLQDSAAELSVKELGGQIGMSLPGASRTVDGLLRRGLVERREDAEDRRIKRLTVTPAGLDALARLEAARLAGIAAYAETLTPEQRARLHDALRSLPHADQKDSV
jgi:DNA-binding MarR family transcriptional regulator